jgi:DNA-binding NtrC family response regulator
MKTEAILLVDDDPAIVLSLALLLKQSGYRTVSAAGPREAIDVLARGGVRLVLSDMNFSRATTGEEGLELLGTIRARWPKLPVILMTAWGSIALAVRGVRAGALDFITKPWTHQQVLGAVRTALDLASQGGSPDRPPSRGDLDARFDFAALVGKDPRFLKVLEVAGRVAATDAAVLITGESGTGKELVAEAIHRASPAGSRRSCSRARCSGTCAARSPTRARIARAGSRWPTAAASSSTRSAISTWRRRSSCSACSRIARTRPWARASPAR